MLVDENWLYSLNKFKKNSTICHWAYFCGFGMVSFMGWVLGTAIGAFYSIEKLDLELLGIDFISAGLFTCILISQYTSLSKLLWWCGCFALVIFFADIIPYDLGSVVISILLAAIYTEIEHRNKGTEHDSYDH